MLRQEIESYPIIVWAWAHNKDDNKQSDDSECECGLYIAPQIYMLLQIGVMALD